MEAISDLPVLHDMDADYTPQYVKLARIIRDKITSGEYQHGDPLPADKLATEHRVSVRVVRHALEMLAANSYVHCRGHFASYVVTRQAGVLCADGSAGHQSSRRSRQPSSGRTSAPCAWAKGGTNARSAN
jgi:DNA-binding transcriptional MocR family regulator